MKLEHDWEKTDTAWVCGTCGACVIPEAAIRFGMSWPPGTTQESQLTSIECLGPCWRKAPSDEQQLRKWEWSVAGQPIEARRTVAQLQRKAGEWAPDPVP